MRTAKVHLVQAVLRRIQSLRNNALFFVSGRRQRTKCFAKERACLKLSAVLSALARTAIGANEHRGSLATSAAENGLSSSKKHFGKRVQPHHLFQPSRVTLKITRK